MYTLVATTYSPLMYTRAIHSGDSCARDRVSRQIFGEWYNQDLLHALSRWVIEYPVVSAVRQRVWVIDWISRAVSDWFSELVNPVRRWLTESWVWWAVERLKHFLLRHSWSTLGPVDQWTNIQKTLQSTSSYTTNWPTLSNQRPPWANFNMRTNGDLFWPGQKEFWVIWGYSGSMV